MPFATQPVRRVAAAEGIRTSGHWPHTIPAVRQLLTDGLDLDPGVTFLVGENGAGKSTLVEAIAVAFGLSPEGGSTGARLTTRATESPLSRDLVLTRGAGAPRWGFLEVLRSRFDSPGLYCLDEPESALSFSSSLALVGVLNELSAGETMPVQNWKAYLQAPERYLRHVL